MNIFLDDQDFRVFLSRLKENLFPNNKANAQKLGKITPRRMLLPQNSYDLICYCLMPNHFHLLIQQKTELHISKLISKVCTSYSMYFNKKYNRIGSLFQDVFKAVAIENNKQLLWTSLYIHENPITAKLTNNLTGYRWNSLMEYLDSINYPLCNKDILLGQINSLETYLRYFKNPSEHKKTQTQMIGYLDLFIDHEF